MSFSYDPFSIEAMTSPHSFYGTLRDQHPAYYMPQYDAWAISRFADVWDGFLDSTHFSEVEGQIIPREQLLMHHQGAPPPAPIQPLAPFPILDAPLHTHVRQAMAPPLRKAEVSRLDSLISGLIADRLTELLEWDAFDLNADFGSYVAAASVAWLVGLDIADVPDVIRLVNQSVAREPGQPGFTEAGLQALGELNQMLLGAISRRRSDGGRAVPLIDNFFKTEVNGRLLSDQEIASNLISIVVGGTETVPKIVAGGMLELARNPDQLREVAADPDLHAAAAVEEMLRYNAPAQWFGRTVKHSRELAGVTLKPGQRVLLLVASANRDPREFDSPDAFIWNRRAPRLVSFGIGPHFCSGIHLARLELQLMVRELLKRMPDFVIDEAAGQWAVSEFQIGWNHLPARRAG